MESLLCPHFTDKEAEAQRSEATCPGGTQPLNSEVDTLESVLCSHPPELYGFVPLLGWPHSIAEPCLCPSTAPQGSQGLTLVSQDKVRMRWERSWGVCRYPNMTAYPEVASHHWPAHREAWALEKAMHPASRSKPACAPRASKAPWHLQGM